MECKRSKPEKKKMQTSTQTNTKTTISQGLLVPQLTPHLISQVLEINKILIKCLIEFQQNNWLNDPDYIKYQKRLATNLQFLAAIADSNSSSPIPSIPSTSPIIPPSRLSHLFNQSIQTDATVSSSLNLMAPPTLVNQTTLNRNEQVYVPSPPFVIEKDSLITKIDGVDLKTGKHVDLDNQTKDAPINSLIFEPELKVKALIEKKVSSVVDLNQVIDHDVTEEEEVFQDVESESEPDEVLNSEMQDEEYYPQFGF